MGDAMLSHLTLLSEKLSDQSNLFNQLTISTGDEMEVLKKKVILTSNKIVDCMKEMDTSVKAYHSSVDQSSNLLRESNKERLSSHANLEASLSAFMDVYNAHKEVNINVHEKHKEIVKGMESRLATVTKEVEESTEKVQTLAKDVLHLDQEDVGQMVMNIEKCISTCDHLNEDLDKCRNDSETCSAEFEKKVTNALEETVKEVTNVFDSRKTHIEENEQSSSNQKANNVKELDQTKTIIDEKLHLLKDLGDNDLTVECSRTSGKVKNIVSQDVARMEQCVISLLDNGLKVYKSTGDTPSRVERQYPRYLATTSPHARLLDRYRKKNIEAEVAAKVPLDESDDSVFSDRISLKAADSKVSLNLVDSSSVSLTSDLERESLDENDRFIPPKPLKRELKKPELIKRNILSSINN